MTAWLTRGVVCSCLLMVACATPVVPEPPPLLLLKPRVALALGGGAVKGFAHVGVIMALEANGIVVDMVAGTSAGSIVGSLYAAGWSGKQLQAKAIQLNESHLTDLTLSPRGLIRGERLQAFINREVGYRPIEKLAKPFGAVATQWETGKRVVFRSGNTGQAVRASASIPHIFHPVTIAGKHYVDGGLVSPVPVSAAREMGADFVIAVDISGRPQAGEATGFLSMLDQSLNILNVAALAQELKQADIVISPQVHTMGLAAFDARQQAIQQGEKAAQQAMPLIQQLLRQKIHWTKKI